MSHTHANELITQEVFTDPIVQLAALCPICALSAVSPEAALAALSPVLTMFNPALNPHAALLAFSLSNPQARFAEAVQQRAHGRLDQLRQKHQWRRPWIFGIPPGAYAL